MQTDSRSINISQLAGSEFLCSLNRTYSSFRAEATATAYELYFRFFVTRRLDGIWDKVVGLTEKTHLLAVLSKYNFTEIQIIAGCPP